MEQEKLNAVIVVEVELTSVQENVTNAEQIAHRRVIVQLVREMELSNVIIVAVLERFQND
jgi:hypothetical protein